jgi:very-short-patch-repair endonuclease
MARERLFVGSEEISAGAVTQRHLSRCDRVYRNVYSRRGVPLTARDRAIAAWLWSGRKSVVAGSSAAALFGAKWVDADTPAELICSRTRPPPMIVTRNETLAPGEQTVVRGIPVTTPARTAFDLGRREGLLAAVKRLDALAHVTGINAADVMPLERLHRGARGMKQLREALTLMDAGAESPQETATRLTLIDGGLGDVQTQIIVSDERGAIVARIDMGWREWRVGVEFDGAQHWTDPLQRSKDIDRAAELARLGWVIIRVSYEMLRNRPEVVLQRVRDALRAAGCATI